MEHTLQHPFEQTGPIEQRVDYATLAPEAVRALMGIELYVRRSGLEHSLVHLVKLRASYLNGCAYCVDMHTKDARADGESEQRLFAVPVWRETPFFTQRERAALALTETVTRIGDGGVRDDVFDSVHEHFSDKEMIDLTMAIIAINSWNRMAITFRVPPGSHVPRRH